MDPIQVRYVEQVKTVTESKDLSRFKSAPAYQQMLEHVSKKEGDQYVWCIKKDMNLSNDEIRLFSEMNDAIGGPQKQFFDGIGLLSPTNLRQLYQAYLILTHFKSKNLSSLNLVEIGGGQGGLCLAIGFLAGRQGVSIQSQTILDLPEILELQRLYLAQHSLPYPVEQVSGYTQGASIDKPNLCLISNQCFSEISKKHQEKQVEILFPKVIHGFLTWNMIPVQNFGKVITQEEEVPQTGSDNKQVRF